MAVLQQLPRIGRRSFINDECEIATIGGRLLQLVRNQKLEQGEWHIGIRDRRFRRASKEAFDQLPLRRLKH